MRSVGRPGGTRAERGAGDGGGVGRRPAPGRVLGPAAVLDLLVTPPRRRSTATVLVTHDRTPLDRADRTGEMHDGRLTVPAPA